VRGDAVTMAVTPRGAADLPLTRTGTLLGTPAYMAPEQLRGEPATARSDQFAFCVTAWEALAGTRPFTGATLGEIGQAIDRGQPAEATRVPRTLRPVLERGLAADPEWRWPAMNPLLDALAPPERRGRVVTKRRRLIAGALGLILLATAGVLWKTSTSPDGLTATCGTQKYRVSSGHHGTCHTTTVTPTIFTMECYDTHGNRGALDCANGMSGCEVTGTGTCENAN